MIRKLALAALLLGAATPALAQNAPPPSPWAPLQDRPTCTRDELKAASAAYVDAQRTGNLGLLPLHEKVRLLENMTDVERGAGLWNTALPVANALSLHDSRRCKTFTEVIVTDGGTPYIIGTRLYLHDGKGYYPFTDDCLRDENGIIAAAPEGAAVGSLGPRLGCREQLETSLFGVVSTIRDRRFVAVDRERGVVFSFAFFDHRPINWTWQLGELFKIENDKISRIEAIFIRGPYGICSGWSTYEQCRSEEIQDVR